MENSMPDARKPLTDSHLHLWRCIIAIVLADGVYHQTERKFLDKAFTALESAYVVTDEHRRMFSDDLRTAKNADELLARVTDPAHRALLPYFGQFITHIDGSQHSRETAFIKHLEEKIWDASTESLHAEIQQAISDGKTQRRFKLIDFLFARLGIGPME
jgi:hypothetical protein